MSTLGIIGGMGVQTTARFYEMLTQLQSVTTEQQYINILIYSKPSTPDRTDFITGKSNISPLDSLIEATLSLEKAGATCLAMPCITAHFFYEELAQAVQGHFINMVEETVIYVQKRGFAKIGLLATNGTLHGGFFQKTFAEYNVDVVLPTTQDQSALMDIIYAIKRGKLPVNALENLSAGIDAQAIVLGCTELGLLHKPDGYEYIEAMEVLARTAIEHIISQGSA